MASPEARIGGIVLGAILAVLGAALQFYLSIPVSPIVPVILMFVGVFFVAGSVLGAL